MLKDQAQTLQKILDAVDFYRGIVLDSVEQEMGDSRNWQHLRSRLLKAFGDRGLANRIVEIVYEGNTEKRRGDSNQ